jgi:hypothetical protein
MDIKEYRIYTKDHTATPLNITADGVEVDEKLYHFYDWVDGKKVVFAIFNVDFVNYIHLKNI